MTCFDWIGRLVRMLAWWDPFTRVTIDAIVPTMIGLCESITVIGGVTP